MTPADARAKYDAEAIKAAKQFTACKFLGAGRYDVREADSLAGAELIASSNPGRWMLYAVLGPARSVHIKNITGPSV